MQGTDEQNSGIAAVNILRHSEDFNNFLFSGFLFKAFSC